MSLSHRQSAGALEKLKTSRIEAEAAIAREEVRQKHLEACVLGGGEEKRRSIRRADGQPIIIVCTTTIALLEEDKI